jgi:anti-sigma B factor antagonist
VSNAAGVVLATARPHGARLTLAGDLDGLAAARLRALLDDEVAPARTVSLDLSRVTRISSQALGVLVHVHRRLRDTGGALLLEGVSPQVVRVLRITGLHRVFPLPDTSVAELPWQAVESEAVPS